MKRFISSMKKKVVAVVVGSTVFITSVVPAFASEAESYDTSGITNSLTSGLGDTVGVILGVIGAVLASGLAIFGAKEGVKAGIKFFKTLSHS